jgi:type II secretory pathway component PulM
MVATPTSTRLRLVLGLGLVLSCGLAVALAWGPLQERRENARLKKELRHERKRLRVLRGLVDTLRSPTRRRARAQPPIFNA